VTARDLRAGQVEHVAEQAADRRAQDMQDVERRHAARRARFRRRAESGLGMKIHRAIRRPAG
jgi:hypothetical protein